MIKISLLCQFFLFNFNTHAIRVVLIEGNPWFVAADVCLTLDMYIRSDGGVNTAAALAKLSEDERTNLSYVEAKRIGLQKSASRGWGISLVSESGLYKLVMRSPDARRPWTNRRPARFIRPGVAGLVTRVVLPAIRKDGMYVAGDSWANGCIARWA